MFCWFCSLKTVILCATDAWFILCTNKIYTYVLKKPYFIFPITKGSVNALMKFAGFSTSNKVTNHCSIISNIFVKTLLTLVLCMLGLIILFHYIDGLITIRYISVIYMIISNLLLEWLSGAHVSSTFQTCFCQTGKTLSEIEFNRCWIYSQNSYVIDSTLTTSQN